MVLNTGETAATGDGNGTGTRSDTRCVEQAQEGARHLERHGMTADAKSLWK